MIIHPPSLYTGFVGCSVPFAFCVAALATGRLDNEWIIAVRKWMLFAFMFLATWFQWRSLGRREGATA